MAYKMIAKTVTPPVSKNALEDCVIAQIQEAYKSQEELILFMLRNQVTPTIKGTITQGKIKWRGLSRAIGPDGKFVGLLQRGVLIKPNYTLFDLQKRANDAWMVGTKLKTKKGEDLVYTTGGIWEQVTIINESV